MTVATTGPTDRADRTNGTARTDELTAPPAAQDPGRSTMPAGRGPSVRPKGASRTTDRSSTTVGGLNAFLTASGLAADAGTTLRLHHPPPSLARIIEITGSAFLLHELHAVRPWPPRVPAAVGGAR